MKKAIIIVLALALIIIISASAQGSKFAFEVSSVSSSRMDEACVSLILTENSGISAGSLSISYDFRSLDYVRYELSENFFADTISVKDNGYGKIAFSFIDSNGIIKYTGELLKLYFSSKGTAEKCEITLLCEPSSLYDDDYSSVSYTCKSGYISFCDSPVIVNSNSGIMIDCTNRIIYNIPSGMGEADFRSAVNGAYSIKDGIVTGGKLTGSEIRYILSVKGDLTGDGKISAGDYVAYRLLMLELYGDGKAFMYAADLNGDGIVTIEDGIKLKLLILNIIEND